MTTQYKPSRLAAALVCALALSGTALIAQEVADDEKAKAAELAKKLQNPIASLISVPIQNDWDWGIGPNDAMKHTVNVQPIIPFSITEDWNLITRTIVPFVYAESSQPGTEDNGGMGDITQSFFLSPKEPVGSWIMGGGPVLLYPSATDDALGSEKWGAGPTFVALQQKKGWTYGALVNHIWSFAGNDEREHVNVTLLQPFVSFTTKTFTSFGLGLESTYDWNAEQWIVPVNLKVQQMLKIGKQPISISFGPRVYVERPDGGPDWGLRFAVTLLFPK
jgi:hypothetical protein